MRNMSIAFFLFFASCICLSSQLPSDFRNHHHNNNQGVSSETGFERDFDYLIFRQIWPASSCMFPGPNTCSVAHNISTWVVHGLWPSIKSEIGPSFCNKTLPFNFDKIKWLLPQLLEFWPNLYTNTPLDSFWKHEWEKHGTCALSLPQIRDESDYFNTSLALRNLYDFGPVLKASGIVPDDTVLYDLDKIKHALISGLKVQPYLVCYVLKDSDVQYFSQAQVCISKEFELADCSTRAVEPALIMKDNQAQETACQDGIPVHYPTIKYGKEVASMWRNVNL